MDIIKCKKCGQQMGAASEVCPVCGTPTQQASVPDDSGQEDQAQPAVLPTVEEVTEEKPIEEPVEEEVALEDEFQAEEKKAKPTLWIIGAIVAVALCLFAGVGYFVFPNVFTSKSESTLKNEKSGNVNEWVEALSEGNSATRMLADGVYCYKGDWESSVYEAQPCKIEFVKNGNILSDCAYTNLQYNTRISLDGTINDDGLHLIGTIKGKKLLIFLKIDSDGNILTGKGVDYTTDGGDRAKLNLTKDDLNAGVDAQLGTYAGLSFRTFTDSEYEERHRVTYQSCLSEERIVQNLKERGFVLSNTQKDFRPDYTGEDYYEVTIETYSKTVNGCTTTVKLESDYTEICFPSLEDVEVFKKTIRACGMKETENGFEDVKEIYWAGTNVYIKGTIVTLDYKWEP